MERARLLSQRNKRKRKKLLRTSSPRSSLLAQQRVRVHAAVLEAALLRGAWFNSGYMYLRFWMLFGRIPHNFYVHVFSEPTGIWQSLVRCLRRLRSTRKLECLEDDFIFFYSPCYLAVQCSELLVRSKGTRFLSEMTSGLISVFSCAWFDSVYMFMSVFWRFGKITRFIREGGLGSCSTVEWHVFPLVVARPKMLDILVGMDQKDSCALVVVAAVVCAWLVWLVSAPLAVFPSFVDRPRMLCIMVGFGPEEQLCSVQDRVDSIGAARRVATTGNKVQTVQKTVWRWRHSFCPHIPASWPKMVQPRSSLTTCSWLVLLVTLHFAPCSLCSSAGPRFTASWLEKK